MSKNRNLKSYECFQAIDKLRNWSTAILLVLMSSISQFAEAQILPSRPVEKRETAQKPRKDFRPSYSSPDQLIIPRGMTEAQVMDMIKQAARTAKSNVNPSANPDIPESLLCEDLKVIFVLDESGSISTTEANLVRTGALALANALNNSGAELRVVEFNTTSSIVNLGSTLVTPSFITSFNNYLYATSGTRYRPVSSGCTGWTNWEDALDDVQTLDGDLVIFFTDGNPTAYNVATSGGCSSGQVTSGNDNSYSSTTALNRAITEANVIKGQGKHMFVAAVGTDLNLDNCIDISGPDDFAVTGSIFNADYTIGEFETLAANLAAAANSICGTELTINKTASATGVCSGETVQFNIQVTNTGGDYNFTAFNVHIEDVFPNGFSNIAFVGAAPSGASISGNTLTYDLASLAANSSVSVTVSATVDVPPGDFNNIATAIADNANEVSDNASVVSGYATETLNIAECSPITVNGVVYSSTGSYTQQLVSSVGCDSILTINFTLKTATTSSTDIASCGSFSWNGSTYDQSGVYTYTTTNAAGCDSIATLILNVTQIPQQPSLACYQNATFDQATCSWNVSGEMPVEPTGLACYQDAVFNTINCSWEIVGDMPAQPSTACYETATFNTQSCAWDVTGDMPAQPSTACYETATFNTQSCAWEVTGDMPAQPSTACYETATFNTQSCAWDVTGDMPAQPSTACYETATFNTQSCTWDVTGDMPAQPSTACYETATFNTQSCAWEVTGDMPAQPATACYETATFNTQSCAWDVTGDMPAQPSTACYETATFNTQSCAWDVTGDMPTQPSTACYETATFNTQSCAWDVTGDMPAQPSTACYETATFNTQSCAWEVTGDMPAQPSTACYETATFNTQSCTWEVTGDMPAQPSTACYETATFNTQSCAWDVTGDMPAQPSTACYETATFNTQSCAWEVTGDMPAQPATACYETATFNTQSCAWEVTGDMPAQPATACYETATFNTQSCTWDVTGDMPAQPAVSCFEYSVFNGITCSWDIFGGQPPMPALACYEDAVFNTTTCQWDVTGDMPTQPSTACYETATFNTQSCAWDVTGDMPAQPSTACYETATFNTQSCAWEVTGDMPAQPSTACYETATFNTQSCAWDVTGDMPAQPSTACYETATFNTQSCAWEVTGDMPAQPSTACYETATFNTQSCAWDVTGDMPAQPSTACYETATFNTQSCAWDVTGDMPAQPSTACYETATFNTQSCEWDVTGEPNPAIVTNASTCSTYVWNVNGETYATSGTFNFAADCQEYVLNLTVNVASTYSFAVSINRGDIYNFNGQTISESGVYTSTLTNAAGCDSVVTVEVIVNEIVNGCYAVEVYNYTQGLTKLGTEVSPERSIPNNALGAPNGQTPAVNAPVQNFFSLGFGGSVELRFADPIANGPGMDLKIWESSASPNAEKAQILVSQDGLGYVPVGTIDMGGEVDFGAAFGDYIQFVKIVDISNPAQFSNVQVSDGYDVDAIECIHGRYSAPNCNANVVVSYNQGKRADGSDVIAIRSNPENALGAPEVSPVGVVDFYALGFGGQITVDFGSPIANGAGDDIRVTETTWNYTCANYPETADVFASQDGLNFVFLGRTCMSNTFDLGGLAWAQYIKVVDASDASLFPMDADGYDVNAIECLHPGVEFLPIPEDFTPCSATEVINYNPGKCKNGNNVPVIRSNADNALGAPQSNDTYNFVSLGFGGSLTLKYDFVIFNLSGDDIRVIETSFGNPTCQNYPEHATISVSMDGVNYTDLGELCLDGTIDLGSVPYAQYIKITDISNTVNFGGSADGYDVDAVVVLNGPCSVSGARMAAIDNTTIADETLEMSLYPNPATEFTVISLDGSRDGETFKVELFDGAGRLISADSFSANGVNAQYFLQVNALESGVYTVRVSNANEQFVQRLVK